MKRLLTLLFAIICAVSMRAATVAATVTYTFTTAVACSATVTTNCMVNFQIGTVSGAGVFTNLAQAPLPASLSGTVTLPPVVFAFNGVYGLVQFGAAVVVKDLNGNTLVVMPPFAPPAANVSVSPAQVTGLSVSVVP